MKTFASPSFFRVFDLVLSGTNPGLKLSRWSGDGVGKLLQQADQADAFNRVLVARDQ
jgi:hypothetical protein